MAKEKFIGGNAKSVPDPGLAEMKARVKEQRAARQTERKAAEAPAPEDDALNAMRQRVKAQRATAKERHGELDAAAKRAGRAYLKATESTGKGKKSTTTPGD